MCRRLLLALLFFVNIARAERAPNIVLVVADGLGVYDLSCYGRTDQPTPALDALAEQGTRFTAAYAAQPASFPSLVAILTGKSPTRLHLTGDVPSRPDKPSHKLLQPDALSTLPQEETTLAQALKLAGYVTAFFGPGPLSPAAARGFDVVAGQEQKLPASLANTTENEALLLAKALEFAGAPRSEPYFFLLSLPTPTLPLVAQSPSETKSSGPFISSHALAIGALDRSIGRLLGKLQESGQAEQTLVVVTSTHGRRHVPLGMAAALTDNGDLRAGSGYLYEGGIRIPLLLRWPGRIPPHQMNGTPVSLMSLLPTLVEASGALALSGLDSASILDEATSPTGKKPTELYWHMPHYTDEGGRPSGALRMGDWKLLEQYEDGSAELYNLANDPGEKANLSAQEPARVADMRGRLAAWRLANGAQENTPNPAFQLAWYNEIYRAVDASNLTPEPTAEAMHERLTSWRQAMDRPVAPSHENPTAPGYLILPAREAIVHGTALRYEPEPHKNTLGYWKYEADTASWNITLPAAGRYAVDALAGCGQGSGGATVEVDAGSTPISFRVAETGHFQNFVPQHVGSLRLKEGPNTITVTPRSKPGVAVMDLRQLTLTKLSD